MSNVQRPPIYKSYQCQVVIFGNTITVTPFYNSVGNIVWSRVGVGIYHGVLNGAYPLNLTAILPSGAIEQGLGMMPVLPLMLANQIIAYVAINRLNSNEIRIITFDPTTHLAVDVDFQTYLV